MFELDTGTRHLGNFGTPTQIYPGYRYPRPRCREYLYLFGTTSISAHGTWISSVHFLFRYQCPTTLVNSVFFRYRYPIVWKVRSFFNTGHFGKLGMPTLIYPRHRCILDHNTGGIGIYSVRYDQVQLWCTHLKTIRFEAIYIQCQVNLFGLSLEKIDQTNSPPIPAIRSRVGKVTPVHHR